MSIVSSIHSLLNRVITNKLSVLPLERLSASAIRYRFKVYGPWRYFFRADSYTVDFGTDISDVPDSVLYVPLMSNLLPVIWVCNACAKVPTLEKDFFDCIPQVREGFQFMYPSVHFGGECVVERIEAIHAKQSSHCSALFFSGGIDSFCTFVRHRTENPLLISLLGSDMALDDAEGLQAFEKRNRFIEDCFGVRTLAIRTEFRSVLGTGRLGRLIQHSGQKWWYGFQHGLAIIGHAAPHAYLYGFHDLYIAASLSRLAVEGKQQCGSSPWTDDKVSFLGTCVHNDAWELNRLEKIQLLARFCRENKMVLPFHVCYSSRGGKNCSRCEKCMRTILALYAAGEDPLMYGFNPSAMNPNTVLEGIRRNPTLRIPYAAVAQELKARYHREDAAPWARWVWDVTFSED